MIATTEHKVADILTFHTNGEDPEWVHDWETAERLLGEGETFHTTQLGLIDSNPVRHAYDRFLLVDGPNEFLFVSDGNRWLTDWTDRPLRKAHRLMYVWERGTLDGEGSRIEPWVRSLEQRRIALAQQGFLGDADEGNPYGRRTATFHAGTSGWAAIHGWLSTRVLIGMGIPFETTQMELLNDWQVKSLYDEIRIIEADGRTITLESDGKTWRTDATEREIRLHNNLFHLWANGEFGL